MVATITILIAIAAINMKIREPAVFCSLTGGIFAAGVGTKNF